MTKSKKRIALVVVLAMLSVLLFQGTVFQTSASAANEYLPFSQVDRTFPFSYDGITAIGGGSGYNAIVTGGTHTITAAGKTPAQLYSELVSTIAQAANGDTIYIEPSCVIEVPESILIDKPLTIASNRGQGSSNGAQMKAAAGLTGGNAIFNIRSSNVRITGLRLRGNKDFSPVGQAMAINAKGTSVASAISNVEIDNCEMEYFYYTSIFEEHPDPDAALHDDVFYIHHNYIHENYYDGLGYGIVIDNAFAKIYANVFHNNRHDIAGTGHPKSGYEAYCNIMLGGMSTQSNFDMHADREYQPDGSYVMTNYAGGYMNIHHNDFRASNPQANIYPVGKPNVICLVANNKFACGSPFAYGGAVYQNAWGRTNNPDAYGNIVSINNIYGSNAYLGWYARETWDKTRTTNFFRIPSTNDLLMSMNNPTISGSWINTASQVLDYWMGDFNGDGVTDILKSDGGKLSYMPINPTFTTEWTPLINTTYPFGTMTLKAGSTDYYEFTPRLYFGNFDNNNTTDILLVENTQISVSYGGVTSWTKLCDSTVPYNQIQVGRFTYAGYNDQIDDLFTVGSNGQWSICYDAKQWINAASSGYPGLKLGSFTGNGISDVFCATGSNWQYSYNGRSSWTSLMNTTVPYNTVNLADFTGNGKTDVICQVNGLWHISENGTAAVKRNLTTNFPLSNFVYGSLH